MAATGANDATTDSFVVVLRPYLDELRSLSTAINGDGTAPGLRTELAICNQKLATLERSNSAWRTVLLTVIAAIIGGLATALAPHVFIG